MHCNGPTGEALTLNNPPGCTIFLEKPASALRDPHKSALINQHHIPVGFGEMIKNGAQHRSL
ncbi:hypothetical protein L580_4082 [Serratia fonticola AU-P3(3)]|nr:hypothetical protein L580_4082 [Serratia fonticola AU-P3(3)]